MEEKRNAWEFFRCGREQGGEHVGGDLANARSQLRWSMMELTVEKPQAESVGLSKGR